MKKIITILFAAVVAIPAFADDDMAASAVQSVAVRRTCAEIKAEIDKISGAVEPTDDETELLISDREEYRTKCTARASGRARRGAPPAMPPEPRPQNDTSENVEPVADVANTNEVETDAQAVNTEPSVPEKTDAEIAAEIEANVNAGLCPDGEKPNRFGCCADETFKDMGNAGFNCCPKSGGDCFPPIK
ncbi:MAG: hypothetical protein IJ560_03155 [Alphaproteobacteria bacterium]|nr:hypothetical protein [Alphaproteobacteria bacterium]